MNARIKQVLTWVGTILAVTGTIFVAIRLNDYKAQIDLSQFNTATWIGILAFTGIYGFASSLLALAWCELLLFFDSSQSKIWSIRVYGITQLAKYVPSNIMHFAGRQAMGMAADISGWVLAKATIWELGLLAFTGSLFSILAMPLLLPATSPLFMVAGFVLVIFLVAMGLNRFFAPSVMRAFIWHFIFLSCSSILFVSILFLLYGSQIIEPTKISLCCGAFTVAWLIGLVTPGAPAGMGVREAVILFLLSPLLPESKLLVALILSRIVTVGGDVVFFFIASLCNTTKPVIISSKTHNPM